MNKNKLSRLEKELDPAASDDGPRNAFGGFDYTYVIEYCETILTPNGPMRVPIPAEYDEETPFGDPDQDGDRFRCLHPIQHSARAQNENRSEEDKRDDGGHLGDSG